jgi:hypothetical protein
MTEPTPVPLPVPVIHHFEVVGVTRFSSGIGQVDFSYSVSAQTCSSGFYRGEIVNDNARVGGDPNVPVRNTKDFLQFPYVPGTYTLELRCVYLPSDTTGAVRRISVQVP